jgi:hypothetical protein
MRKDACVAILSGPGSNSCTICHRVLSAGAMRNGAQFSESGVIFRPKIKQQWGLPQRFCKSCQMPKLFGKMGLQVPRLFAKSMDDEEKKSA